MNQHFARIGDVWKHLPLAEVLRINPPLQYWETHAGSATYPLTEDPFRLHGVYRFCSRAPEEPSLAGCTYLQVLHTMPSVYPGSAMLAMRILGNRARYVCCDLDPNSIQSLRAVSATLNAMVIEQDGVSAIAHEARVLAVNSPSDVFVHIDPFDPHERMTPESLTPIELAASLARKGFRVMYWYGYDEADLRGWAFKELSRLAKGVNLWCGDVLIPASFIYPNKNGAWGCGVVLANMTLGEASACTKVGQALERIYADDVLTNNNPQRLSFRIIS